MAWAMSRRGRLGGSRGCGGSRCLDWLRLENDGTRQKGLGKRQRRPSGQRRDGEHQNIQLHHCLQEHCGLV